MFVCYWVSVSSLLYRRGNWITLKMKKLIKPKSRDRIRSLTLTPSRSEFGDSFLMFPQDSQDSSSIGSGTNSLDDTLSHMRSSSESERTTHTQDCIVIVSTITEGTSFNVFTIIFVTKRRETLKILFCSTHRISETFANSFNLMLNFLHWHIMVYFVSVALYAWVTEWVFPPNCSFASLYLSAKGGEGSSLMPKCRVPPMVCCGWGGWEGFVTRLSRLSGHVFVSPLSISLSCRRDYGWAVQADSWPQTWLKMQKHFLCLKQIEVHSVSCYQCY